MIQALEIKNSINDSLTSMETQNAEAASRLDTYILENTPQRIRDRYHSLSSYAKEHSFGELDEDVVVIDTETTGFSFNHDELIQIAAARMVHGEIVGWYVTFVNPGKPIPEEVAHLTIFEFLAKSGLSSLHFLAVVLNMTTFKISASSAYFNHSLFL